MSNTISEIAYVPISQTDIETLDIETLMMRVNINRTKGLDGQLRTAMSAMNDRNVQTKLLCDLKTRLTEAKASEGSEGNGTMFHNFDKGTLDDLKAAGITVPNMKGGSSFLRAGVKDTTKELLAYNGKATVAHASDKQIDDWATAIQNKIDSAGSTQQAEMLQLQQASNRRNEAFEVMTGFVKKMSDSRSGIISNMR